ncbi:MAG: peptidoglycan bridge formation glycyltransferase FemA/FemB family protein [Bacilli bacterium]|nr:peptidoglycan bridge formation glycyltransferase FemA/FemB family protein [Bacilli bacterium]
MRIITLSKEEFDQYSLNHKYSSYCQTSNYANLKAELEGYDIHYLGFKDNGVIVGASMLVYKEIMWGYKYAYAPRGFLIDYSDLSLCRQLTEALKRLLKKQKFIFIKLDPPIIYRKYDGLGDNQVDSESSKEILRNFKKNNYEHMGFNLYNENMLPRFSSYAKLDPNPQTLFMSFSKERQNEITLDQKKALAVIPDEKNDINFFLENTKRIIKGKNIKFIKTLFNVFDETDNAQIFYTFLDTQKYTESINKLYNEELEKNNSLANIISESDARKYNMQLVISDKIESDKRIAELKSNLGISMNLIRNNPEGLIIGASLVITSGKGANIISNYVVPEHKNLNALPLTTYEIMKYYGKKGYSYIDLGSVPGNFNKTSKYFPAIKNKSGYNSSIIEYVGELDLVINPLIYSFYKRKLASGKIKLKD